MVGDVGKILLGTASFGSKYGIANSAPPSQQEVKRIITFANQHGFGGFDTARDYDKSEERIGESIDSSLRVYTKFSHGTDVLEPGHLRNQVLDSARRLSRSVLDGISFHNFNDFLRGGLDVVANLESLKEEGLISSWGLSLYEPEEFFQAIEVAIPGYIQIPLNVVDRRFTLHGVLEKAEELGISVQIRSIYLQGALLQHPDNLPPNLTKLDTYLERAREIANLLAINLEAVLLNRALMEKGVNQIVIGVNSLRQIHALKEALTIPEGIDLSELDSRDEVPGEILDPRRWAQ